MPSRVPSAKYGPSRAVAQLTRLGRPCPPRLPPPTSPLHHPRMAPHPHLCPAQRRPAIAAEVLPHPSTCKSYGDYSPEPYLYTHNLVLSPPPTCGDGCIYARSFWGFRDDIGSLFSRLCSYCYSCRPRSSFALSCCEGASGGASKRPSLPAWSHLIIRAA